MIQADKRVRGEFYVCPVFNELTEELFVRTFPVTEMFGIGTPEDLQRHYDQVAA